ncbi:MAG: GNAT family N-acetyltransferase [Alphaproteobacteria bacterium]|nr:GNAT family N-acetyltransferase [Alphaproteobacteria bacterium]
MIDVARVTYRDARAEDAAALAEISRATFLATFGHLYTIADRNAFVAETYGRKLQAAEIADPEMRHRLAFDGRDVIGFAKMGAYKLPVAAEGRRVRELHRLYVVEAAKGAGIAAALMEWTIATARGDGADALYLGVWQGNARAQRFYARYGFEIVGEYTFEVGAARDPEYVMRKPLA